MTQEEIGGLLRLAAGETNRTTFAGQEVSQLAYPSAGAAGAVSLHVWVQGTGSELDGALWRYIPQYHGLTDRRPLTLKEIERGFAVTYSGALSLDRISLMCFLTLRLNVLSIKYGARAYRLGHLEAGHLAQNLLLTACAEGRAAIPWGGFFDDIISASLALSPEEVCIYAIPIG
ncbi:nitroreductase family protein [Arcanobacterium hippocoleae]